MTFVRRKFEIPQPMKQGERYHDEINKRAKLRQELDAIRWGDGQLSECDQAYLTAYHSRVIAALQWSAGIPRRRLG